MIQEIREKEISELKRLAFGRAFERAMAHSTAFLSSLVMFILADTIGPKGLTFALIFSTLEIFSSVRRSLTWLNIGVGLYFEIKVVFGRFASIFNIPNKSMIEIDPETKQVVVRDEDAAMTNDHELGKKMVEEEKGEGNVSSKQLATEGLVRNEK